MAALSVGASAFLSFAVPLLTGAPHEWSMSNDVWATTNSTQYIVNGGAGYLYSANPWFSALPGFLYIYAPLVALGDHLHLTVGYPFAIPRPTMWLLTGPFFAICGSTAVLGVDYLAATLDVSRTRRRLLALAVALLAVAPTVIVAGHPEDLVALALCCLSLSLLLRGRLAQASYVLALAVTMQTWAGLLIPVIVASAPPGSRLRTALRASAFPASVAIMLLVSDWKDASLQLLRQPLSLSGQAMPWESIVGRMQLGGPGNRIDLMYGSDTRSVAVLAALAAAWWVYRRPTADRVMFAAAVVLYCRGLVESDYWPYYFLPGAVFLAVIGLWRSRSRPKRAAVCAIGAFAVYGSAPLAYWQISYSPCLALFVPVTAAALCVGATYLRDSMAWSLRRELSLVGG